MITSSNPDNTCRDLVLLFCMLIPGAGAHAYNTPDNSQYNNLTIRAGTFVIRNANTDIRVDDPLLGAGVVIDLDKTLDMDSSSDSPRLDIQYKFNPYHGIDFSWYPVRRSGEKELLQNLSIRDTLFPAGTNVKSYFNTNTYKLAYNYTMFNHSQLQLNTVAGITTTTFDFGVESPPNSLDEHFFISAPLPILGFSFRYGFTEKLYLRTNWEIFFLHYNDYSGTQTESNIAFEHQTFKNMGIGVGVNKYFLKLRADKNDFAGTIENGYTGYLLYGIFSF
jgi:hypothetical protein